MATNPLPRARGREPVPPGPALPHHRRAALQHRAATSPIPRRSTAGSNAWTSHGRAASVRAFPPRMIHVLAGNSPRAASRRSRRARWSRRSTSSRCRRATRSPRVAMLRTMAEIDPDHPVVQSMSAVYWRGGDERVERTLYRPQYFDKIVAWGGGDAINNVIKYLGPGLQLVSFDPKTSISMIGPEGFASDEVIDDVAETAATRRRGLQPGGVSRQPLHLRRGRAGRHRAVLRAGCRNVSASIATPPRRSPIRCPSRPARRSRCCRSWTTTTRCGARPMAAAS